MDTINKIFENENMDDIPAWQLEYFEEYMSKQEITNIKSKRTKKTNKINRLFKDLERFANSDQDRMQIKTIIEELRYLLDQ